MRAYLQLLLISLLIGNFLSCGAFETTGVVAADSVLLFDAEAADGTDPASAACTPLSWSDISGENNDGTLLSCPGGSFGWQGLGTILDPEEFAFNGTNQSVVVPSLDVDPTALPTTTWMAWIKPGRLGFGTPQQILSIDSFSGNFARSLLITNGTNKIGIFTGPTGGTWTPSAPDLTLSNWYFVAVVFKADNILYYHRNEDYSYGAAPDYDASTPTNLSLGASNNGAQQHFLGSIAWAAVYDRELTQSEILSTCNSLDQRYPGALCE